MTFEIAMRWWINTMTSWGKYLVSRDTVLIVTQRVIDGPSTSCMTVVKFLSSCMTVVKKKSR